MKKQKQNIVGQPHRLATLMAVAPIFIGALQILATTAFAQGQLTPPGAPAPTMKTLEQIEPRTPVDATHTPGDFNSLFRISQPGAYYLVSNVVGAADFHGLKIDSGEVSVDLNGFALVGVGRSLNGVHVPGPVKNIAIDNGTVRGWGGYGVDAAFASNSRLTGLRASGNGGSGLRVGNGCLVQDCLTTSNTGSGIVASINCVVRDCVSASNGGVGIRALDNSIMRECIARQNSGAGIDTGTSCLVDSCVTRENGGHGLVVSDGGNVRGCVTQGNGGDGLVVSSGCVVQENLCANNGDAGIRLSSSSNLVMDNLVAGFNPGGGFRAEVVGGSELFRNVGGPYSNVFAGCQMVTNLCPVAVSNPWNNFP